MSTLINSVPINSPYISNTNTLNNVSIAPSNQTALVVSEGKMNITVPLDLNGLDVEQILKDLMSATGIISRNRQLEARYPGMQKAGEQYQEILQSAQKEVNIKLKEAAANYRAAEEKYKTFHILKELR